MIPSSISFRLYVGAPGSGDTEGVVYIFELFNTVFECSSMLRGSTYHNGDMFGNNIKRSTRQAIILLVVMHCV